MRMDPRLLYTGLSLLFFLTSCGNRTERQSDLKSFDLEGLVDSQVSFLVENEYQVIKKSSLGTSNDLVQYVPDSAGWVREMSIIRTVDISKPGLRSYYSLESYDSLDCTIEHYTLLDPGNSNTLYQKIYRDAASDQLLKIKALQNVSNPIYDSKRYLEITFQEVGNDTAIIDSIVVSGYQTMILSDTVIYQSISKILPGKKPGR
jgi:hypothetical protein